MVHYAPSMPEDSIVTSYSRLFLFTKNAPKMVIKKVIRKACNEGVKACYVERVIKMPLIRSNGGALPCPRIHISTWARPLWEET